jgi:RNA polymerase-binding protein DksA
MNDPEFSPRAVPERWRWHYEKLAALRERILEERESVIVEAGQARERDGANLADSATDEFDRDLALGLLSREQDALYEIDAAMRRIETGGYGVCEITGEPIDADRLRAVPWTRFSREAAERLESDPIARGAHLGDLRTVRRGVPKKLGGDEPV